MKKIFLLSLLSVLLLSAFSQTTVKPEILSQINISRTSGEYEEGMRAPDGWWIFFYKIVRTEYLADGYVLVTCYGWGLKLCLPPFYRLEKLAQFINETGLEYSVVEEIFDSLFEENNTRANEGEYRGSISKKLAFSHPRQPEKPSYLIFTMNWDFDEKNPRTGNAEIIISTTNSLGF